MKTALLIIFFSISFFAKAQTENKSKPEILMFAEQMPEYPGGQDSLMSFISRNISYPTKARENGIEARILIGFVVGDDGKVRNIEALSHKGFGFEEEGERVIKLMPDWIPGKQNGSNVPVKFTLPIVFKLSK